MTDTRTEVYIETSEFFIVRRRRRIVRTWCPDCGREVNMMSPGEAALMMCQPAEAIFDLIDNKHLHTRFLKSEQPYVCLKSLCFAFQ